MTARSSTQRGGQWRRVDVTAEKMPHVAKLLREAGSVVGEGEPITAHAHYDRHGRVRRVHARYANGWRATLTFRSDGSYSLSQALKLTTMPKVAAE